MPQWVIEWENCGVQRVVDADNPFLAVITYLGEWAPLPALEMKPGKDPCCQWIVSEVGSDTYFSIRESWS